MINLPTEIKGEKFEMNLIKEIEEITLWHSDGNPVVDIKKLRKLSNQLEKLARQGDFQPVFACGSILEKQNKLETVNRLILGYYSADNIQEAKGKFLEYLKDNKEFRDYRIVDLLAIKIEIQASKST